MGSNLHSFSGIRKCSIIVLKIFWGTFRLIVFNKMKRVTFSLNTALFNKEQVPDQCSKLLNRIKNTNLFHGLNKRDIFFRVGG